jgi:hypothetical protein
MASAPMHAQIPLPDATEHSHPVSLEDKQREFERQRLKAANKQRQEDMKRDTDKLLQLATELKQYMDKTNENVLSLEVVKKAAEIEKLSKEVQKKMRADYCPASSLDPSGPCCLNSDCKRN